MEHRPPVIDYQPGDGRKRRRYPAWLIVELILAALVGAGILGT
jgi:hypothetical protein